MFRSVEKHCGEVVPLGPAGHGWLTMSKIARRVLRMARYNIDAGHTILLSKAWGQVFQRKLASANCDAIFAPVASTELAFLETDLPVVYYSDITAELFLNYSAGLTGLSKWALRQSKEIERLAFHRADKLVFSSQWAANSAMRQDGASEEKIRVVQMGANLVAVPALAEITAARNRTHPGQWRLLFVGVDWERKGGDIALAAMQLLRARGVNVTLTVVGCVPPSGISNPHLEVIPFLDKAVPEQQQQLGRLMLQADFMIFPTRRDASPIICAEANAFGLPLVAADLGGLAVRNGENGILLRPEASATDYADVIQDLMNDSQRYLALALGGRSAYDSRLNWDAWGRSMAALFHEYPEKSGKRAKKM